MVAPGCGIRRRFLKAQEGAEGGPRPNLPLTIEERTRELVEDRSSPLSTSSTARAATRPAAAVSTTRNRRGLLPTEALAKLREGRGQRGEDHLRRSCAEIDRLRGGRAAGDFMRGNRVNPLLERIAIDPRICGGKPCIKGTRIWVSLILDFLADDMTEAELLDQYPGLTHKDVLAAIAYGAEAARERVIPVPAENLA